MSGADTPRTLIGEAERLAADGQTLAAVAVYRQALARWPQLADSWYNLGLLLRRAGHFEAALEAYAQALARGVRDPEEVHLNRAVILTDHLRRDEAAEAELQAALRLNPDYLPALMNLANLRTDQGDRAAARGWYERLLGRHPRAYEALARLAQLQPVRSLDDPIIARLQRALADPAASPQELASLGFALAHALDGAGAYPAAFAAATAANRASRAAASPRPRYDRRALEDLIDTLIAAYPSPAPRREALAVDAPIFVCGMFRSGSTLAEHLLAAAPGVAAGGEMSVLRDLLHRHRSDHPGALVRAAPQVLRQLAQDYRATVARLFPQARQVIDKRPDNFFYLGMIKSIFPGARIVHTTRDPMDTALSIYFLHLDPQMAYAFELRDIGHYYRQYARLMAHWRTLYGEDIFELNYDTLVREPEPTARGLFEYCGLPWDSRYLDFEARPTSIKTASVWQVRERLYRRASGRARNYAAELEPLRQELAGAAG